MKRILTAFCALVAAPAMAADLTLCGEGAYPPFSVIDNDGAMTGFDIDIGDALCAAMGKSCDWAQTEWDAIIPALLEGKCDAIIASMSITPERQQRVDFSRKYYNTPARFVAEAGVDWVDTNEGMAGKRVCVQRGSVHQDYVEGAFPDIDLALYPTQEEANLDLASGRCDAGMADMITLQDGFLNTEDGKGYAFFGGDHSDPKYHGEGIGIAVRKGEGDLRDAFTAAIQIIRDNGVYKSINDKYFDFDVYGG